MNCACASSPDEKLNNGHTQACTDKFNAYIDKILERDPYEELML